MDTSELPAAPHTDPQTRILQVLALLPEGSATSYGHVAEMAGLPGRARLVARVLSHLPQGSQLPWYRVMRSNRQPAFPAGSKACREQWKRLRDEGVDVSSGRVAKAQWLPCSDSTRSISRNKASKLAKAVKSSR